jgi:hypothetical protein
MIVELNQRGSMQARKVQARNREQKRGGKQRKLYS